MVDEAMFNSARMYLTYCAPIAFTMALAGVIQFAFLVQRATAAQSFTMALAGVIQFAASLVLYRMHNIDVQYRPMLLKWHEIVETFKCGVPSSSELHRGNRRHGHSEQSCAHGLSGGYSDSGHIRYGIDHLFAEGEQTPGSGPLVKGDHLCF